MSYKYLLTILISGIFFAALSHDPKGPDGEQPELTVMSYNIHHGRGLDDVVDLERIAEVIVESGAEIVALQEVDVGVERSGKVDIAAELARLTGLEHYVFGKNLDHEGGHYGVAVISGYPITDHQNLQFEKMGNEQRSIQVMKMNVKGFPLLMMNTHLAHRRVDEPERLHFMQAAKDEIIPRYPEVRGVIFAGDFNDVPESATHRAVKGFMKDVWEVAGDGTEGYTIPPDNPGRRIDYIFYNGNLEPSEAYVPYSSASDHLPVVATFQLK
ncbi:MAG TPA: endonuclease/exonuclease/phosphatase family protein [Balneolaceae bacterium]|nr:endonuclease/exonuclease/phosphatase family protein [Balneolaceae bacterium]